MDGSGRSSREKAFYLILMDMQMPEMDGWKLRV